MNQAASSLRAVKPAARPVADASGKRRKRRVIWKPHEQAKVIARASELLAASPRMLMHVAARRAQEELLEPDRWKVITQHKHVAAWLPMQSPVLSALPEPRAFPRAIKPALPERAHAEVAAVELPAPPEAVDPAITRAIAEQLMPMLAATLNECTTRLCDALADAIRTAGTQTPTRSDAGMATPRRVTPPPPRTRLPRVCVVGLINQQEHDVSAAFEGVIEFIFVKAQRTGGGGHGGAGMLTRSASSDLVIAMTDFIGHDVEASAKHLHVPFERITGSVSALKRWLTNWLATGTKQENGEPCATGENRL